jgi:carotenoid 1,2-hydratase
MTERGQRFVERDATTLRVGPSSMTWHGSNLVVTIDERCVPLPFALRGTVTLRCEQLYDKAIPLDGAGKHLWQAIAPHADISVDLTTPGLHWHGKAYHDMNWGEEPLEDGFASWSWQRAANKNGSTVFYDALRRDGTQQSFGLQFEGGVTKLLALPALHAVKPALWRVERRVFSEQKPVLVSTLEDAPFYTRNHIRILHEGALCDTIHESLSLDRFKKNWVQKLLPFRMLRKA